MATKLKQVPTANKAFSCIARRAEKIKSDAEAAIEVMDVGNEVRQGDVYVTRIDRIPSGTVVGMKQEHQLAPGTTQGSRHCIRSLDGVQIHSFSRPGPLDGPIIVAKQPFAVDHPEHGNRVLPPGIYAITYQRAFAEELRRVQD